MMETGGPAAVEGPPSATPATAASAGGVADDGDRTPHLDPASSADGAFQPDPRCRPSYPKKEGSCHFFLARKRRYCNIKAIAGSKWCGNHRPGEESAAAAGAGAPDGVQEQDRGKKRVACPVDPTHTIYAHNLRAHVRVCTRSKENDQVAAQPFYRADANSGPPTTSSSSSSGGKALAMDDIPAFFDRAQVLAEVRRPQLFPTTDAVQQLTAEPAAAGIMAQIDANGWAHAQGRHVVQQASLVSHLHRRGLLDGATTAVELGAGRGSLGLAVKLAFPSAALVMVERAGVKFKADKQLRRMQEEGANAGGFRRLRMDLRHLYVQGLGLPVDGRLAFVGKHVCGVATDLSLRAVATYLRERAASASPSSPQAVGLAIACCCYHVCRWDDYVGREVWDEELGWGRAEFEVVQRCACWVSSCYGELNRGGGGDNKEEGEEQGQQQQEEEEAEAPEHTLPEEGAEGMGGGYGRGLSPEQKLAVGTACKRLIDYGRLEFLRRACGVGVEGEVVTYCEPSVSPENTCIMAWTTAEGRGAAAGGGGGAECVYV